MKKIGLALGSGSSRGWAHIGMIKALLDNNIPIHYIAGASVGAFVGTLYAADALESLERYVREKEGSRVFSLVHHLSLSKNHLISPDAIDENFFRHTKRSTFSQLNIPVSVVASNLTTGNRFVFNRGSIVTALRASMAIPGVLPPLRHNGSLLVDGGLLDPVPIGVVQSMGADIVIACDLNNFRETLDSNANVGTLRNTGDKLTSLTLMGMSIEIMQERLTAANIAINPPDILISPRLGDWNMWEYDRVDLAIQEGYDLLTQHIDTIKKLLQQ